jgi:hypothetical protein
MLPSSADVDGALVEANAVAAAETVETGEIYGEF